MGKDAVDSIPPTPPPPEIRHVSVHSSRRLYTAKRRNELGWGEEMRGEEFGRRYLERKKMKHRRKVKKNIRKEQWGMREHGDGERREIERVRQRGWESETMLSWKLAWIWRAKQECKLVYPQGMWWCYRGEMSREMYLREALPLKWRDLKQKYIYNTNDNTVSMDLWIWRLSGHTPRVSWIKTAAEKPLNSWIDPFERHRGQSEWVNYLCG